MSQLFRKHWRAYSKLNPVQRILVLWLACLQYQITAEVNKFMKNIIVNQSNKYKTKLSLNALQKVKTSKAIAYISTQSKMCQILE